LMTMNLVINRIEETKTQESQTTALHASFRQSFQDDIARNAATYGSDHPAVAESQNALGLFYHHVSHEPEKALSCHVKALKIYKSINSSLSSRQHAHRLQKEDEDTIINMGITVTDIGNVQWARGDYKKAIWAFEDSLAVFIWAGLDDNHPRIVSTQNRLNLLLDSSRERAKSIGSLATMDEIDKILMQGTARELHNCPMDRYCS